jgi:hypothetical protein
MINIQTRKALKSPPIFSWSFSWMLPSLILSFFSVFFACAQAIPTVEWKEGLLSVVAEKTSLSQVLQEVSRQTGIEIRGLEELQEEVSVSFASLPLHEGIQKLLSPVNYIILEDVVSQGGVRPTRALILGRRRPSSLAVIPEGEVVPLERTSKAEVLTPGEGAMQLEDEQAASVISADQGGTPLEDELATETIKSDQGGTPLEDELAVGAVSAGQGGTPLADEPSAAK